MRTALSNPSNWLLLVQVLLCGGLFTITHLDTVHTFAFPMALVGVGVGIMLLNLHIEFEALEEASDRLTDDSEFWCRHHSDLVRRLTFGELDESATNDAILQSVDQLQRDILMSALAEEIRSARQLAIAVLATKSTGAAHTLDDVALAQTVLDGYPDFDCDTYQEQWAEPSTPFFAE